MKKQEWVILTKPSCSKCMEGKYLLEINGRKYEEIRISSPNNKQKICESLGIEFEFDKYPQIILYEDGVPNVIGNVAALRKFFTNIQEDGYSEDELVESAQDINSICLADYEVLEG